MQHSGNNLTTLLLWDLATRPRLTLHIFCIFAITWVNSTASKNGSNIPSASYRKLCLKGEGGFLHLTVPFQHKPSKFHSYLFFSFSSVFVCPVHAERCVTDNLRTINVILLTKAHRKKLNLEYEQVACCKKVSLTPNCYHFFFLLPSQGALVPKITNNI